MAGLINGNMGLLPVSGPVQMAEEQARLDSAASVSLSPLLSGLAGHVKRCFDAAYRARNEEVFERMLQCQRQRAGKYDPDLEAEIKKGGGSMIYMMISSNKCRAAASWIKDVLSGTKDHRAWDVEPTAEPQLSPVDGQDVAQRATQEAMMIEQQLGQGVITPDRMKEIVTRIKEETIAEAREMAERRLNRMRTKMDDQLQEGGFTEDISDFIDDLVTYPFAVLKGPVVRKRKQLVWKQVGPAQFDVTPEDTMALDWERVDPFRIYWAPHAVDVDDGYLIEHHTLTRGDLLELVGVEGYDEAAIRAVLEEHGTGGLKEWMAADTQIIAAKGQPTSVVTDNPEATIDALQFWGTVSGQMLIDFGMEKLQVPDPQAEYSAEVWTIGKYVIKAMLNPDVLDRKPYYKTSYEKIPGSWAGNGVCDLVRDAQRMCNAAARSLADNMSVAAGPQVYVHVDRLPAGEDVTQVYPLKVWQVTGDPMGGTAKPVDFFQPSSNAQELLTIYQTFSVMADEYSGVPRYMTGDSPAGGAGRTASGMSMLMTNANKSIKQVMSNLDLDVIGPVVERLYYYNMRYMEDPDLKGDVRVVARGVNVLVAKEAQQVRLNELLQIVMSNPMFIDIVGEEAIADLLREITKIYDMDIVPPKEIIRARMIQRQQMMLLQQMLMLKQAGMPEEEIQFDRGEDGSVKGAKVMPGNKQRLMNGGAITDNFAPARRH